MTIAYWVGHASGEMGECSIVVKFPRKALDLGHVLKSYFSILTNRLMYKRQALPLAVLLTVGNAVGLL